LTTAAALANNIQDIEIDLLLEGSYRAHGFDFREYSRASIKRRVLELKRRGGVAGMISQRQGRKNRLDGRIVV